MHDILFILVQQPNALFDTVIVEEVRQLWWDVWDLGGEVTSFVFPRLLEQHHATWEKKQVHHAELLNRVGKVTMEM